MQYGVLQFLTDYTVSPMELARGLEERCFDTLMIPEHTHIPGTRETPFPGGGELPREYSHTLDPFVALTAAAAVTEKLQIGTGISLVIQHDPIILAKRVSTLDLISNGRFLFGIGAGWNREEMADHGTAYETRWTLLRERIEAMKALWTEEEASYHGKFVNFDKAWQWPKPVQKPHPQIFQPFASSERSIRWCAKEGVIAVLPPIHPKLENYLIEVYADESGKPKGEGVAVLRNLIIADTDEEALELAQESAVFARNAWFEPFGFGRGLQDPDTGKQYPFEEMFENGLMLVGSVDTVCKQLEAIQKSQPISWVFAWCYTSLLPHDVMMKTFELYATKVLPRAAG